MRVIIQERAPGELAEDLANGGTRLHTAVGECAHAMLKAATPLAGDGEVHALRELADLYAKVYAREIPAMAKAAAKAARES